MIKVENLTFSYSKNPFIDKLSFEVSKGEIFGFLGPSGAGKSTLQKILTGMISSYTGKVLVGGLEASQAASDFYEMIGVDFEFPCFYEKLSAYENLVFFASLYKNKVDIHELLEKVGLKNDAHKKVHAYSKGMKSRLNFIRALLHDPEVIFLDEPTSGLDPSNARVMKDMILELKARGKTIILTTHHMYDAQELCDRVAFIVDGQIKALDTPKALIMRKGASMLHYSYQNGKEIIENSVKKDQTNKDTSLITAIKNNQLITIHSSEPTLNEVFSEITGRVLE